MPCFISRPPTLTAASTMKAWPSNTFTSPVHNKLIQINSLQFLWGGEAQSLRNWNRWIMAFICPELPHFPNLYTVCFLDSPWPRILVMIPATVWSTQMGRKSEMVDLDVLCTYIISTVPICMMFHSCQYILYYRYLWYLFIFISIPWCIYRKYRGNRWRMWSCLLVSAQRKPHDWINQLARSQEMWVEVLFCM